MEAENAALKVIIEKLIAEIELLRNGRKSFTSSTPPSQDIGRSNAKSLREPSDKPSGGQKGHQGKTLLMTDTPDQIIDYVPRFCNKCGWDMSDVESIMVERKQEIEIPPIRAQYIEHRSYEKQCSCCGEKVNSSLPTHLKSSIQYGTSVSSAIGYLSVYQYLPYKRLTALLEGFYQLQISEGTVQNILDKLSNNAIPAYKQIHQKLSKSEVVGADETGTSIANRKGWFFTWQNETLTYLTASFSRGYNTIENIFPNGLLKTVLVSDSWAAQLKTPTQQKQLCTAHLLRELKNFETALNCHWSKSVKQLLQDAIEIKRNLKSTDYSPSNPQVQRIEKRLDSLLSVDLSDSHKKVQAFIKRLKKYRYSLLTFLYYNKVPPDNNSSERAVRNLKVKNKISGCFRSEKGANQFAILRSVTDTANKNNCSIFDAFKLISTLRAE